MPERSTTAVAITRFPGGEDEDVVATEEPLEIRVGDRPVSVTLRTPGHDRELAAGFLFTESIVGAREEVESIRHWGSPNVIRLTVRDGVRIDLQRLQRHFYSTSSCGVCGKTSIDALRVQTRPLIDGVVIEAATIMALSGRLKERQQTFAVTGGIHAAGAFRVDGTLVVAHEDIGRHNAVDKAIGSMFLAGESADALLVSGRTSFEIVQKCVVARIPILAAVGAPSSLAVELAREFNLTLIGFARDGRFNVYGGQSRIAGL